MSITFKKYFYILYSRLNFVSKRKLAKFIEQGLVSGWDFLLFEVNIIKEINVVLSLSNIEI